ncbi:amino acid ABC transporter substrate-binding protein [Stutzerimonas decontaminans]|uniref:Amino acid ABC transporter substrate-binding protein n=2 Tax=Stutzerimonas decontaminans TaxID=3022791 RepID=A0ABX4VZ60_9GAMM|nr:transporter substrate-binding domain-containing protein [Stutzerimonas decontaminans]PNF85495.1 amino acid ABC transporter substrate-binding protein [Stutzerimonas decontaminans]
MVLLPQFRCSPASDETWASTGALCALIGDDSVSPEERENLTGTRRVIGLILLLASASLPAEVLRLAGNVWPPYTDRSLPGDGVSVELIRTALGRAGYQVEYIEVPWERALLGLRNRSYDMVNGWSTVKRVDFTHSSRPFLINRMRWVQRRGSNIRYDGLDSLVGHPIVLSRGYMYSDELDQDARLQKGYAANFVQAAKMVLAGRVDLTLEDELTALFHLERELGHERDALEFVPGEFRRAGLSLLVRSDHPRSADIIATFNREITAMIADGSYAAIFVRHGMPVPKALP